MFLTSCKEVVYFVRLGGGVWVQVSENKRLTAKYRIRLGLVTPDRVKCRRAASGVCRCSPSVSFLYPGYQSGGGYYAIIFNAKSPVFIEGLGAGRGCGGLTFVFWAVFAKNRCMLLKQSMLRRSDWAELYRLNIRWSKRNGFGLSATILAASGWSGLTRTFHSPSIGTEGTRRARDRRELAHSAPMRGSC
jgi:hypothetical protein